MIAVITIPCSECDAHVDLPVEGGGRAIAAGALTGWIFDSEREIDERWRCPNHDEET